MPIPLSATVETAECLHCGQPVPPTAREPEFCCSGCRFVHGLLRENGLERFYSLRDGKGQPVKTHVFEPRDFDWLREMADEAARAAGSGPASLILDIQGISCLGCVWLIEEVFNRNDGALSVEINSALGQLRMQWTPGAFDPVAFAREIQSFGYLLAPPGKRESRESGMLVRKMGVNAALAANCMMFTLPSYFGMDETFEYARLFSFLTMIFATASLMHGGSYFIQRSWQSLRRRMIHIDLPIALGIVFAYTGSLFAWIRADHSFVYFDFVSIFIFLMLVGRWTQQLAVEKNRNYLLNLQSDRQKVTLPPDADSPSQEPVRVPLADLSLGSRFTVSPGQFLPVRSLLLSGSGSFGMEWINGESEGRVFRRGQAVPAGAIPLDSMAHEFRAEEDWKDSFLARLTAVKPRGVERYPLVERIISIYIGCVFAIGAVGFSAWYLFAGDAVMALQVLVSVLVVSCPCAIGVAWPLNDELAAAALRKHGVFLREPGLWHRIGRVRKILFDKTGTLTLEHLGLRNPETLESLASGPRAVLHRMVEGSLHPVSRCLRQYLTGIDGAASGTGRPSSVEEAAGQGLEARTEEGVWRLGRPDWAESGADATGQRGGRDCLFTLNGKRLAEFQLAEEVRNDAREEVARWRRRGFDVFILSGDRSEKVRAMGRQLGLPDDRGIGEMSPEDKADWIRRIDDRDTLMIGDGANDSLAFDATWCRGTPAVDKGLLEQKADFFFLGKGLGGIRSLFEMAGRRRRTLRRVFTFTVVYNVMTLSLCLAGKMNPLVAAIVMPLSSLISVASVWVQRPR